MFKDNGHKGECSTYNNNIIQDSDKKKIVLLLKFDLLKFHSKREMIKDYKMIRAWRRFQISFSFYVCFVS